MNKVKLVVHISRDETLLLLQVKQIQRINEAEGSIVTGGTSWHDDFDHSAFIYIGGLNYDLTEGDVLAVFSQYGEPMHINLVRDKGTGKSKGFCFLGYEDQRSTRLAVDNLNGIKLAQKTISVDHCKDYTPPEDAVLGVVGDPEEKKKEREERKRDKKRDWRAVSDNEGDRKKKKKKKDKEKKKKKKDKKEKKKKHRDKEQSLGIPSLKLKLSIPIDKVSDGASEAVVIKTISDEPQPKPKVEESKSPSKANSQESKVKVEPTLATSGNVKGKKTKKETSKKSGTTPSKKKANVKDPPEGIVTPSPQGNPQVLATPALLHKLSWRPTEDRLRAVLPPKRTKRALLKPKEKDSDFYCVCGLGETDDAGNYIDMVQCNDCEVWYHFNCVGLDTTTFDKEEWRCPDCLVDTKAGDVIDHPLTSDMQQGLIKILNSVRKEKGSKEFEVAPTDSIAPHYSFYIFEPCDFQTVHKRLNEGKWYPRENKYPCIRAFDRDMQLIFDNCVCYNQNTDEESTRLRRLAESVGKAYNKKIENFLAKLREESIS
eukprot:m.50324 g.50324  ORF g.50324 m.50324 type:complete len:542 (+) comp10663_c0_seq1:76-1701(+)